LVFELFLRPTQRQAGDDLADTGCRVRRQPVSARSSPACLWVGRRKSSFPCSQVQRPKLPDCFFQVCAFALFLLRAALGGYLSDAMSIEKRYFTSDFSNLS